MTTLLNDDLLLRANLISDSALTENGSLKIKTITRLKKLLQREKQGYLGVLHQRTGWGLPVAEFTEIVRGLVACGWCSLREGRQGGVKVIFNEQFTNVNVPDGEGDEQR